MTAGCINKHVQIQQSCNNGSQLRYGQNSKFLALLCSIHCLTFSTLLFICFLKFDAFSSLIVYCVAGGLDEALYNVIAMAREQEIPFVFALGRKALGRCVNKLVPVSVVGIFNYSGAEVHPLKVFHCNKFILYPSNLSILTSHLS